MTEARVAYHEAGHAVIARVLRCEVPYVEVERDRDVCQVPWRARTHKFVSCPLPSKSDRIATLPRKCRKVPKADSCTQQG
jgi:hypothetical protein